jgi:riboflavin transporter FmnP
MKHNEQTKQTAPKTMATFGERIKKRFSARRIAFMAIFVALAFVVSIFDFPLFPASPVSFLKFDFGNVFILLISFLLGPVEGVIVCIIKELLRIIVGSTGGVGEIANMITTTAFILLPSIVYQYRKGIVTVIISLIGACVLGTVAALFTNRYITFPLYMKGAAVAVFNDCFWLIAAFNIVKTLIISVITVLLYKRLSNFLKAIKL